MNILSQALHADYKRFFRNIRETARKAHKNSVWMTLDVGLCTLIYGSALTDYFNYEFYNKTWKERSKYAVVHTQDHFYQLVNDPKYKKAFTVKPNFLREFAEYAGRDWVYPSADDEANWAAYNAFLDRHDIFMAKPIDGLGGGGIYKTCLAEIGDRRAFFEKLIRERYYLEEVIRQCPELASLNPSSVNTIRVMTHNIDDHPTIFFCSVRVGNGNTVVDNFHSGGMSAVVDPETGIVTGPALDKSMRRFDVHPTTGVVFKGFQIPCWEEAKQMVYTACRKHPEMTVIGWDVSITDHGPILIEGNRRPGWDMVQMLDDMGEKDKLKAIESAFVAWKAREAAAQK